VTRCSHDSLDLLTELRRELSMALVLVTHDLALVESACSQVAVMYAGATIEAGAVQAVMRTPSHPYTQALLAAQPSLAAIGGGHRLRSVPGVPPELGSVREGCSFAPRCPHATERCEGGHVALEPVATGHEVACRRTREVSAWT
jgi:oligopeptide/dipeptide ABC transporter ATP-binding protein